MRFVRDAWPIVVIVGTIAGAAWMAAWNVRDFLTTQTAASESRLTAQIAATDTRLTAQIAATDTRLTALDNRLTTQIAGSEARLAAQIGENQAQIAEIRQLFVDHLEYHANAR